MCDGNLQINAPFESDIEDFEETDNCDGILAIIKSDDLSEICESYNHLILKIRKLSFLLNDLQQRMTFIKAM